MEEAFTGALSGQGENQTNGGAIHPRKILKKT